MGLEEKNLLTLAPGKLVNEASAWSGLLAPSKVVTVFAGIVFVRLPLTVMATLRVSVHLLPAGKLPPLNEKELSPEVPLSFPLQVPTLKFRGLARIIPGGILSVNAIPVSPTLLFGFINRTLIVDTELPNTVKGLKPFTTAMDKLPRSPTLNVAVRSSEGVLFSLFVMFVGGMILSYTPAVLPVT